MKRIFITGIKGFLGSSLARELELRGHQVTGSSHEQKAVDEQKVFFFDFLSDPPRTALSSVDCVVHCAHDLRPGSMATVIQGTNQMVEAARNAKVKEQIFISSISAINPCSEYGYTKSSLEQQFLDQKMRIVRLGLVLGTGGLFARMISTIKRSPIIPLLDGGQGQVYYVSLEDAITSLAQFIENRIASRLINIYHPEPCTMRALVHGLVKKLRVKRLVLDIPLWCVYYPLKFAATIKLPLPIGPDNLKAYQQNQNLELASDLLDFVAKPDDLNAVLSRLSIKPKSG